MKYSVQVEEHFFRPRNVGEMPDADASGMAKNPNDGDVAKIYLKISDEKITEATFKTMGCVVAIAASSKLTELLQNLYLDDAIQINKERLNYELGGVPERKVRCSLTCIEAMQNAIEEYRKSKI